MIEDEPCVGCGEVHNGSTRHEQMREALARMGLTPVYRSAGMEEMDTGNQAFGWPQYTVRGILTMFSQAMFVGGVLYAYMTGGVTDALSMAGILGPVAGIATGMYFGKSA